MDANGGGVRAPVGPAATRDVGGALRGWVQHTCWRAQRGWRELRRETSCAVCSAGNWQCQ